MIAATLCWVSARMRLLPISLAVGLALCGAIPAAATTLPIDGLSEVAGPEFASSDPTYYSGNRRAAMTAGGRMLVVHGRHASGVQLAWRDPAGGWQRTTTGATADGSMLAGAGTGDRPASIAVAQDDDQAEHAWVVWGGQNSGSGTAVRMRRLSNLDSPDGPSVGPVVTIDEPGGGGAYRPDLAFQRAGDGTMRGSVA